MFFDKKLMENKSVAELWRTAHNFEAPVRENARPLHEICRKLDSWVNSEGLVRSQRLSLRTSSTLVAGAARVLLRELRSLCHDAQGMEKDLTLARRRLSVISEGPSLPSSSSSSTHSSSPMPSTPEMMMKQATEPVNTSTGEIRKRPLEVITSKNFGSLQHSMSFSDDNDHENSFIPEKRRKFSKHCEDDGCETEESIVYTPEIVEGSRSPISKEQETQTVAFPEETAKENSPKNLDPTKPYGCVFIYAKGSVVPTHIVVSNINPQILGLAG